MSSRSQWKWYATPRAGEPGIESWPTPFAAERGGAAPWQPVTYDPDLNLIYVTTGNPQPVIAYKNRLGDNLFTASIVALNPDDGKMKWYFQSSPHDTHDRDANQTPILIDADYQGRPRKLIAMASRSGYYFLLDRATGESYCIAHHLFTDDGERKLMVAWLRYDDAFVKVDGAWLFAERNLYVDWTETRPSPQ